MGHPSRAELVRDAVRGLIKDRLELARMEGSIDGVLILLYDNKAAREVSDIRHSNMHLFKSFMHTDFADHTCSVHDGACKCCEILLFSGDAEAIREVHNRFRSAKHVEESHVFLA